MPIHAECVQRGLVRTVCSLVDLGMTDTGPSRVDLFGQFIRDGAIYSMMPIQLECVTTDQLSSLMFKLAESLESVSF